MKIIGKRPDGHPRLRNGVDRANAVLAQRGEAPIIEELEAAAVP
jgi:hypothetical protein